MRGLASIKCVGDVLGGAHLWLQGRCSCSVFPFSQKDFLFLKSLTAKLGSDHSTDPASSTLSVVMRQVWHCKRCVGRWAAAGAADLQIVCVCVLGLR